MGTSKTIYLVLIAEIEAMAFEDEEDAERVYKQYLSKLSASMQLEDMDIWCTIRWLYDHKHLDKQKYQDIMMPLDGVGGPPDYTPEDLAYIQSLIDSLPPETKEALCVWAHWSSPSYGPTEILPKGTQVQTDVMPKRNTWEI